MGFYQSSFNVSPGTVILFSRLDYSKNKIAVQVDCTEFTPGGSLPGEKVPATVGSEKGTCQVLETSNFTAG